MALNIKNRDVDRLARRSAELRQTSLTNAIQAALERDVLELEAERARRNAKFSALVREIQAEAAAIPDRDNRSVKEISDWLWDDGE